MFSHNPEVQNIIFTIIFWNWEFGKLQNACVYMFSHNPEVENIIFTIIFWNWEFGKLQNACVYMFSHNPEVENIIFTIIFWNWEFGKLQNACVYMFSHNPWLPYVKSSYSHINMREMDHTTLLYFSVKREEEDAEAVVLSFSWLNQSIPVYESFAAEGAFHQLHQKVPEDVRAVERRLCRSAELRCRLHECIPNRPIEMANSVTTFAGGHRSVHAAFHLVVHHNLHNLHS